MIKYEVSVNNRSTTWRLDSSLHREGGPAVEYANGDKYWYINDKVHREGGPAIEYACGYKAWYLNGKCHREDGPAIELTNGTKQWYLEGEQYNEEEFNLKMNPQGAIMPRPDDVSVGTAIFILNNKDQILLGKRKGAHAAGCWSFPGGWLDVDDIETKDAVIRETAEETGLIVHCAIELFWQTEYHKDLGVRTVTLYHLAFNNDWEGEPKVMEPNKCEVWDWFNLNDLPEPLFPRLQDAIDKLENWRYSE